MKVATRLGAIGRGRERGRSADRIALVRHRRGAAAAGRGRLERFADLGLHHQRRRRARSCRRCRRGCAKHGGDLGQTVAVGVPGRVGKRQVEQRGEPLATRRSHARRAPRACRRRRRTAAPALRAAAAAVVRASAPAPRRSPRASARTASAARAAVSVRATESVRRWRPASVVKPLIALSRSATSASIAARNSSISAVSITSWLVAPQCTKLAASGSRWRDLVRQRVHQRRWRCCRTGSCGLDQGGDVVVLGLAGIGDRRRAGRRNHADRGLGAGQRGLEVEHALQPRPVAHDGAHRRAGEQRRQ